MAPSRGKSKKASSAGSKQPSTKPVSKSATITSAPATASKASPQALQDQQAILTAFRTAFPTVLSDTPLLHSQLQEIKKHLFARDFGAAFGSPELLKAYAVRWSPSRA